MHIAVIGAGAAGLCAARHSLAAGHNVIVFEQTADVGGTWLYTDQVGKDEYGLDIHSSMYRDLRTNIAKEIMSYPDYPIPHQESSFVPCNDIQRYLETFADDFDVRQHIRFRHHVIRVHPIGDSRWELIVKDLIADRYDTIEFDSVIVCNGHFSVPRIPTYKGRDTFTGRQMHTHEYRVPETFKDKTVLIVGYGYSGVDIALAIAAVARRLVVSYHKPMMDQYLPRGVQLRPNVKQFGETEVEFVDGEKEEFTDVVFCTGYKYEFPFLSVDTGIYVEEGVFVRPLFKQCINIEHPTMLLPGLCFRVCPLQVMDVQVRAFLSFLSGHRRLPSREEMLQITAAENESTYNLYGTKRHMHMLETLQAEYYNELTTLADVENIKPYLLKVYNDMQESRQTFGMEYRRLQYRILDDETFTKTFDGVLQC